MSLFGNMGSRADQLTPWLSFTISLVYCIAADGEVDEEEIGYLLTALGGERIDEDTVGVANRNREILDRAIAYTNRHTPEEFLETAAAMLNMEQKLCILMNMADSALSDGIAEDEEQRLILQFKEAFGVSDDQLAPLMQALLIKNDKSVF